MSKLRAILDRINDVEAAMAEFTMLFAESNFADKITLQSLENRRDDLKEELAEVTKKEFIEICDYRLIPDMRGSYALSAVTKTLQEFQEIFSIVYDALTSRPKQRVAIDAEIISKTSFDFGFAYAGSLGIALTIPNERLIALDSDLDVAIQAVFSLTQLKTPETVKEAEALYGPPAIRKLYSWARAHRDYGMSANIQWVRGKEVRSSILAQSQQFAHICQMIETTSEDKIESVTVTGILNAWNVVTRKFMLDVPDAEPVSGYFSKTFDATIPRTVGGNRYEAILAKHTKIVYTSEKDTVSWELNGLREIE